MIRIFDWDLFTSYFSTSQSFFVTLLLCEPVSAFSIATVSSRQNAQSLSLHTYMYISQTSQRRISVQVNIHMLMNASLHQVHTLHEDPNLENQAWNTRKKRRRETADTKERFRPYLVCFSGSYLFTILEDEVNINMYQFIYLIVTMIAINAITVYKLD